jgi:hypothetical protein
LRRERKRCGSAQVTRVSKNGKGARSRLAPPGGQRLRRNREIDEKKNGALGCSAPLIAQPALQGRPARVKE